MAMAVTVTLLVPFIVRKLHVMLLLAAPSVSSARFTQLRAMTAREYTACTFTPCKKCMAVSLKANGLYTMKPVSACDSIVCTSRGLSKTSDTLVHLLLWPPLSCMWSSRSWSIFRWASCIRLGTCYLYSLHSLVVGQQCTSYADYSTATAAGLQQWLMLVNKHGLFALYHQHPRAVSA